MVQIPNLPLVMGVLNVTPDSFSDGGCHFDHEQAVARARQMIDEGAAIIDVGPESTRPGASAVADDEQCRRAIPVIESIRDVDADMPISIDTRSAAVADHAIRAGATIINDVSALCDDPGMIDVARRTNVDVILMHRRGTSRDMQEGGGPTYADVLDEVMAFLAERKAALVADGVPAERLLVDPGIGFGKRVEHNVALLAELSALGDLGCRVVLGASRKRFIGSLTGEEAPDECRDPARRVAGSVACALWAARAGAYAVRVHDVRETVDALTVWHALEVAARGSKAGDPR